MGLGGRRGQTNQQNKQTKQTNKQNKQTKLDSFTTLAMGLGADADRQTNKT